MHLRYIACMPAKLLHWCLNLCDPMVCSLPASSVHGSFQARTLERVATSFSMNLLDPGIKPAPAVSLALQADSLSLGHQGSLQKQVMKE